ncbi:MAG: FIST C-terminal domain-containing protein [Alphaproteobacteria bacterium]|nr:FIST C-terminal domain-containing protein [Alphaproteobacteria bacterium]
MERNGNFIFATAAADDASWGRLTVACAEQIGEPAGMALGFVYASDHFAGHLGDIAAVLRRTTGIRNWVGSVATGIVAGADEIFDKPALAVMAAPFASHSFRLIAARSAPSDGAAAHASGGGLAIVHGDPRNPQLAAIVEGIAQREGGFVVGGLTVSRGAHDQVAGAASEGGVSGVWLAPEIGVAVGLTQGCAPIGPVREITAGTENVVFEIDGRPALDVLKDDVGELIARRLERVAGYVHVAFPVAGSDTGDYLVRNLVGIDRQRNWIAVGDRIEAGRAIRFVRRDRAAAEEDLVRMLGQVRRRIGGRPRGALYHSCVARGPNLFGADSQEVALVRRELGDVPLVGMFCNGEISNARLYGYTAVLTLFA